MINGVEALIKVEQKLEEGTDIKEAMGEHADILGHWYSTNKKPLIDCFQIILRLELFIEFFMFNMN